MSESARKKQRIAVRESDGAGSMDPGTPYNDLHQLASIIPKPTTPFRRPTSAGPTPESRRTPNFLIRTPGTVARTPRGVSTRQINSRRAAPTTPHAIRALRERAIAAKTPGRRRSGRVQRETPRDMLRALSKALAPESRPSDPSPQLQGRPPRNSALDLPDIDDGPEPTRPRLSMALDDLYEDDSDDNFDEAPPRRSLLPDLPDEADGDTMQSLEFGRRVFSEDPRAIFNRRQSERFGDLTEMGLDGEEYEVDGTFINRRQTMDADQLLQQQFTDDMGDTGEIQALTGRRDGRPSDVNLGVFGEMDEPDEPTFRFVVPERMRAPAQDEPPETNQSDDDEDEDVDAVAEEDVGQYDNLGGMASDDGENANDHGIVGWESDNEVEDDAELQAYREEVSAVDRSLQSPEQQTTQDTQPGRQRKAQLISASGLEYPSFPAATIKRIASGLLKSQGGKTKINKDTLTALVQTTDWFFEQVGQDLGAYAQHAGRKMIEEADVVALMKRQRQITNNATAFSLAQKMLPRELLQELRVQPVGKLRGQKRKRMEVIPEEEDEE